MLDVRMHRLGYAATDVIFRCPVCGHVIWSGLEDGGAHPPYVWPEGLSPEKTMLIMRRIRELFPGAFTCPVCGEPREVHKIWWNTFRNADGVTATPERGDLPGLVRGHEAFERLIYYGLSGGPARVGFKYIESHILVQIKCTNTLCKYFTYVTI